MRYRAGSGSYIHQCLSQCRKRKMGKHQVELKKSRDSRQRKKIQRYRLRAYKTRGQLPIWNQRKHTSHTLAFPRITLLYVSASDIFSIFSFLRAFLCTPLAEAYAASTCPSSCPWGLIPRHQFVLEEDRGLPFIHPCAAPYSTLSDLLSVWHLTPLSLQPWRFSRVSSSRAPTQTLWFCSGVNILRSDSFVQIFETEQIRIF